MNGGASTSSELPLLMISTDSGRSPALVSTVTEIVLPGVTTVPGAGDVIASARTASAGRGTMIGGVNGASGSWIGQSFSRSCPPGGGIDVANLPPPTDALSSVITSLVCPGSFWMLKCPVNDTPPDGGTVTGIVVMNGSTSPP